MKRLPTGRRRTQALIVVICALLGLLAGFVVAAVVPKQYTATASLFLRAPDFRDSSSAYQGDLFSQQRARSYAGMVNSEQLAQLAIDHLGMSMSPADMAGKVTAAAEDRTVLMTISATDSSPEVAAQIANGYAEVFPAYMATIENVGSDPRVERNPLAAVVQTATVPTTSNGVGTVPAALGGAGLGTLVGLIAAFGYSKLDNRVRDESSLETVTGHAVVGVTGPPTGSSDELRAPARDEFRRLATRFEFLTAQPGDDGVRTVAFVGVTEPNDLADGVAEHMRAVLDARGFDVVAVDAASDLSVRGLRAQLTNEHGTKDFVLIAADSCESPNGSVAVGAAGSVVLVVPEGVKRRQVDGAVRAIRDAGGELVASVLYHEAASPADSDAGPPGSS